MLACFGNVHVFNCFQVWDGPGCEKPGLAVQQAEDWDRGRFGVAEQQGT